MYIYFYELKEKDYCFILAIDTAARELFLQFSLAVYYKLISIAFKMLTYNGSFKPKPKMSNDLASPFLNTYQGEIIRKSTNNSSLGPKKEKIYRKVITQGDQSDPADTEIKRMAKGFKMPMKPGSPVVKKNVIVQSTSPTNKLCFSNNTCKMKRVKKLMPGQKAVTETGPIIQRVANTETFKPQQKEKTKEKKYIFYTDKNESYENCKQNNGVKKITDSKNTSNINPNQYMKARMNTEGTLQSTPPFSTSQDIQMIELIGQGTFGKVFKGKIKKTGQIVAIKRVFQDPKYKNRQIQIVNMLKGDFVMKVLGNYSTFEQGGQYLNIVMTHYEGDLYTLIRQFGKRGLTTMDIKLFSFQIFRGLNSIHQMGIAHRDIKPHNILYKGKRAAICDFGSAKILTNEPNLPYICSRCYRAPELIFGATHYTTMIDIWSVGCVLLEMIQGCPLFMGESSIDHLIQIIKVLGTPTKSQVIDMNPNYDLNDYKFPKVKKRQWNKIFPKTDPLLLDLLTQILIYSPKQRLNAAEALAHEFYDELRQQPIYRQLQKQYNLNLFSYRPQELKGQDHLLPKLIPAWYHEQRELNLV